MKNQPRIVPEPTPKEVEEAMSYLRKLILQKLVAIAGIILPFLFYRIGEGTGLVVSLIFFPCCVCLLFCKNIVTE